MSSFFQFSYDHPWFFTNYSFLFVLGFFFVIYAFLLNKNLLRKLYLVSFSLFFFYKSSGPFLGIFILLIICDYSVARLIEQVHRQLLRKLLLFLSVCLSLSFLLYFKYSGFFLTSLNELFNAGFQIEKLFLPIGISFYTFQSISYIVDVYQKKIHSTSDFLDYAFYMTFFPHLVAGPIVRAKDFIPQINRPAPVDMPLLKSSLFRILIGLTKKLLIADYLAKYIDMIHTNPSMYSGMENLLCMYAYSCQIYFDFSGYSDIAIAIALLMGYELKENFNHPYHAKNITDFWRRWHISLSSWLKDYIYIPLGGNRKGAFNTYLFLMITMTIGGIWHGASWNFIVWGIAHGFALVIHKLFFSKKISAVAKNDHVILRGLYILFTFHLVSILWIFFRAQNIDYAIQSIRQILHHFNASDIIGFYVDRTPFVWMLVLALSVIFMHYRWKENAEKTFVKMPLLILFLGFILFFQLILHIKDSEVAPFIYFQF